MGVGCAPTGAGSRCPLKEGGWQRGSEGSVRGWGAHPGRSRSRPPVPPDLSRGFRACTLRRSPQ
eukprot:851756-Pyramimonas_sp.AAC.1